MDSRDPLFQAILAEPDDDSLRLVYADYLEEQGEPERAAFVRVQLELARLPEGDERRGVLEARERALLKGHEAEWVAPLRKLLAGMMPRWAFHRGFVEELVVEARGLLQHADAVFGLAPVRAVEVYIAGRRIEALASLPHLARLAVLRLRSNLLQDGGVCVLARSRHLSGLTSLDLAWNGIGDAGIEALAACPSLSRLAHLDLTMNRVGNAGALALVTHFPHLQSLTLYWNPIDEAARRALIERFGDSVKLEEACAQRRLRFPDS
jgi:uncharacterized protein (TIGR02996 family)